MIGRPEWFKRRKYSGWGLFPCTWQGYLYIAAILLPFAIFQALPYWSDRTRIIVTIAWLLFLLADTTHIMVNLKRDEREYKIEAIAERNAAWAMVLIAAAGILYQIISSGLGQKMQLDWFLVAVLIGGVVVKSASNIILEKKDI